VRPVGPLRPWLLGLVFWLVLVPLTFFPRPRMSGNVWSRYMTIESMVERGTQAIGRSPMLRASGSPDLAKFGGRLYSDKPPALPALGAAVYAPLTWLGLRFMGSPQQLVWVNLVLVSTLVGSFSALTLVGLRRLFEATSLPRPLADLLTLGFGFGSLLLTYGVTFNNHSVASGGITLAFALVLLEGEARTGAAGRRFAAGALAGLAAVVDLPAGGVMFAGLGIWLVARTRGLPLAYLAGAAGPLLLHTVLQSAVTGTPLPVEMYPEAFEYPGSYWSTEEGRWREVIPRWQFGLEVVFGPQGWLTVTPVLVFGLLGLGLVLSRKGDPLRPAAGVVAGAVSVLVAYYVWGVRRCDYSGQSFGTRHLMPLSPLVFFFACVLLDRVRSRVASAAFAVLFAIGVAYAVSGAMDPWSRIERRPDPALRWLQKIVLYPKSSYAR
jgi:hypothetical protein